MTKLTLSPLPKVWIFDLDGSLVIHNGYKSGRDELLPGVTDFFKKISPTDYVLIVTGREPEAEGETVRFLNESGIRFDKIIFGVPLGERILLNDDKPSGLPTSFAVRLERDRGLKDVDFVIDENL